LRDRLVSWNTSRACHKRNQEPAPSTPGKIADFLVVDGDPMADIRNLRRTTAVVKDTRAYDPPKLWEDGGVRAVG
jgi:hypothetical protein